MRTILICGSRGWTDADLIARTLDALTLEHGRMRVIHGDARGADRIAAAMARARSHDVVGFPADWRTHGYSAGFVRNVQMLDEQPDEVVAFQVDHSRGTQHTIDEARRRGIPVEVISA